MTQFHSPVGRHSFIGRPAGQITERPARRRQATCCTTLLGSNTIDYERWLLKIFYVVLTEFIIFMEHWVAIPLIINIGSRQFYIVLTEVRILIDSLGVAIPLIMNIGSCCFDRIWNIYGALDSNTIDHERWLLKI